MQSCAIIIRIFIGFFVFKKLFFCIVCLFCPFPPCDPARSFLFWHYFLCFFPVPFNTSGLFFRFFIGFFCVLPAHGRVGGWCGLL